MKKSLLALAVLTGFAGVASAQSSVTLFGVVDVNVRNVKNGGKDVWQTGTDGLNSSRLGFRGTEDLGGGLKAGFWLEAALNPDDGTSNADRFWHRRATVSLESAALGEVRLGRDFTPSYTGISSFDPFGDNGGGKFSSLQKGVSRTPAAPAAPTAWVDTNTRSDNEIQYFLPKNLGGVYGSLAFAPGEGTVGKKYVGGRVGYAAGPLDVSGSYGQTDATTAEDKYKVGSVGAAYDFGVLKVMGSFTQIKYVSFKERMFFGGVTVPVGSGVIRASLGKADLEGGTSAARTSDADDATLAAVGYVHNLSKRTALYTTYSQITNKGNQNMTTLTAPATVPAVAGEKSRSFELGLRHSF
jgi:predicted porin